MDFDSTLDGERNRRIADWAQLFDNSLNAIGELASKYRENSQYFLVSKHCGSFNFGVRIHWDDSGPDWLIRFPIPGKAILAEEKFRNEISVMKFIRQNTSIPVPEIFGHGTAAENPTGLGPFIIMTWIEGKPLKDIFENKENAEDTESVEESILDFSLDDMTLKKLYNEVAGVLVQLWSLEFDKIGSLDFDSINNAWEINRRPLTLGMNELVRHGGIPPEDLGSGFFTSSLDYFHHLSNLRSLHLRKQKNSIDDSRDCRQKYTCRYLLKSVIPFFADDVNGPFKLFCDDLSPGNILFDPRSFKITGIIDWEFCYAAPSQFLASPPSWLLLKHPDHWVEDSGLDSFMNSYIPKFELLVHAIEVQEKSYPSIGTANKQLSQSMRQSIDNRMIWFNLAIRNGWSLDFLYWNLLDNYIYGTASVTERVARVTGGRLYDDRERFVRSKIQDLQRYNAEIGEDVLVEYESEKEDEKLDYWTLRPRKVGNYFLHVPLYLQTVTETPF